MAHLYGHRWVSMCGDAMTPDGLTPSAKQWLQDLKHYTPEQVAVGIQAVVDKRLEWPPGPIEFANLCDGIPTAAEVLDRANDYGPVCAAIRKRIDWFAVDGMSSAKADKEVKRRMERALTSMRADGTMLAIRHSQRLALSADSAGAALAHVQTGHLK